MFEYIRGPLTSVEPEYVVVEAGGIGYRIFVANPGQLAAKTDSEVKIYLHQIIKEDALFLYGFSTLEERDMFRHLIAVSGIGPKGALSILSHLTPQQIALAIVQEDVKRLKSLPGIGQKTAERLIFDLKDKLKGRLERSREDGQPISQTNEEPAEKGKVGNALEALLVLGYHEYEIAPLLKRIDRDFPDLSLEELIRKTLSELGRR